MLLPPRRPILRVEDAETTPERREGASDVGMKALAVDARKARVRLRRSIGAAD